MDEELNLAPFVIRFTWVFVLMSVVAIMIVSWLELSGNVGLGIGVTMASAVSAGQKFLMDKGRILTTSEKLRMSTHSLLISWVISLLIIAFMLAFLRGSIVVLPREVLSPVFLASALLIVSVLYFSLFYLTYGFILNRIFNGMVKRGEI